MGVRDARGPRRRGLQLRLLRPAGPGAGRARRARPGPGAAPHVGSTGPGGDRRPRELLRGPAAGLDLYPGGRGPQLRAHGRGLRAPPRPGSRLRTARRGRGPGSPRVPLAPDGGPPNDLQRTRDRRGRRPARSAKRGPLRSPGPRGHPTCERGRAPAHLPFRSPHRPGADGPGLRRHWPGADLPDALQRHGERPRGGEGLRGAAPRGRAVRAPGMRGVRSRAALAGHPQRGPQPAEGPGGGDPRGPRDRGLRDLRGPVGRVPGPGRAEDLGPGRAAGPGPPRAGRGRPHAPPRAPLPRLPGPGTPPAGGRRPLRGRDSRDLRQHQRLGQPGCHPPGGVRAEGPVSGAAPRGPRRRLRGLRARAPPAPAGAKVRQRRRPRRRHGDPGPRARLPGDRGAGPAVRPRQLPGGHHQQPREQRPGPAHRRFRRRTPGRGADEQRQQPDERQRPLGSDRLPSLAAQARARRSTPARCRT